MQQDGGVGIYFCPWLGLLLCPFPDAGGVQVSPHLEAGAEGETGHDAALCVEAAQGADQVSGAAVAKEQHEDNVCHLPEGAASAE